MRIHVPSMSMGDLKHVQLSNTWLARHPAKSGATSRGSRTRCAVQSERIRASRNERGGGDTVNVGEKRPHAPSRHSNAQAQSYGWVHSLIQSHELQRARLRPGLCSLSLAVTDTLSRRGTQRQLRPTPKRAALCKAAATQPSGHGGSGRQPASAPSPSKAPRRSSSTIVRRSMGPGWTRPAA